MNYANGFFIAILLFFAHMTARECTEKNNFFQAALSGSMRNIRYPLGFAELSLIYIGHAMSVFGLNEISGGMKLIIDNDPCVVVDNEFVKPGKARHLTA